MNQAAIIHRPTSDYIYPSSRNTLELQLITARGDADEAELWYWMRYETDPAKIRRQRLHVSLQDALHDYYRTTVCTGQIAAYTRYCFHLRAGTDELWLGANGLQETEPAMNGNFFEFLWPNPTDGRCTIRYSRSGSKTETPPAPRQTRTPGVPRRRGKISWAATLRESRRGLIISSLSA